MEHWDCKLQNSSGIKYEAIFVHFVGYSLLSDAEDNKLSILSELDTRLSNHKGYAMHKKGLYFLLIASALAFSVIGCSSNQAIKTSDGRTIVTNGKPQIDSDTGLVSYKDAQTGRTEQINRDKITNMSELDN